jgi:hypothetical protein
LGVKNETYVFYTADNGGARTVTTTVNDPLFLGKWTPYEGGVRVPFFVEGPGIAPGSVSDVPVISMDLFPTISALAGIATPLPTGVEGGDLSPVLRNGGQLPAGASALARPLGPQGELFFHYPHHEMPSSAIRDGDYKLIRFYGRSDPAERILLFDLAADITETNNPRSPKNLAATRPAVAAALEAKLDAWLETVDATLPYDVAEPQTLTWNAALPAAQPAGWRSVEDVDSYFRETWLAPDGRSRGAVASRAHQPGLPDVAVPFDGSVAWSRPYFHVSTPASSWRDRDHSASWEAWIRFDDLAGNQILFESGDPTAGVSLTVGDGDGLGGANDLRFRVLGSNGDYLAATAPLDRFAAPTADFLHIVASLNDAPTSRSIELYVNGALQARADGLTGADRPLDWDGFDPAGLGGRGGAGLGAAGGAGPQPFAGNLRGQLALLRFRDRALSAADVLAAYNELLPPVGEGLAATFGAAAVAATRPADVAAGKYETGAVALALLEREDVLDAPLAVDLVGPALTGPSQNGTLPRDTPFRSYLLHFDPLGIPGGNQSVHGSFTFADPILGVIHESSRLAATDASLGSLGSYAVGPRGLSTARGDYVQLSADGLTLSYALHAAGSELVQLRVLTGSGAAADDGPDFNGDGRVDLADLTDPTRGWERRFGAGLGGARLLAWQRAFDPASAVFAAAAIPEPAGLLVVAQATALAALPRRSRRPARALPSGALSR